MSAPVALSVNSGHDFSWSGRKDAVVSQRDVTHDFTGVLLKGTFIEGSKSLGGYYQSLHTI